MDKSLAPIALFAYKRLECLKVTINALKKNHLARRSLLYVFSDAPKNDKDLCDVKLVRDYLETVSGFKDVIVIEAEKNKGLADSIIGGVTNILEIYDKVIVVEDDLITSPNFLDFMNQCLVFYQYTESVFSISGFSPDIKRPSDDDFDSFVYGRAHSWGWATWGNRWNKIDWEVTDWYILKNNRHAQKRFNLYGSDLFKMLKDYKKGKNNSWYVRFTYSQQKQGKFTIYPYNSKVLNVGFDEAATHCNVYNRTNFNLDVGEEAVFQLQDRIDIKASLFKQIVRLKSKRYRAVSKILTYFMRWGFIKQRTYKKWD